MCLSTAGTIKTTASVLLPWELACSSSWLRRKDESSLGHLQGELPYGAHIPTAASSTAGPLPAGQRSTVTVHSHPGERQQTQCRYSKISVGLCRASMVHYYQRSERMYLVLCSDCCCSSERFPVLPPLLSSFFPRSLRSALRMGRQQDEVTKANGKVMATKILY